MLFTLPISGYDGGDCCRCTCVDRNFDCGENNDFTCRDPSASCFEDNSTTSDISKCESNFFADGDCDLQNNKEECGALHFHRVICIVAYMVTVD